MISIYKIISIILIPLIKLNIFFRIQNNKEISSRYKERFGLSGRVPQKNKKILWIHASSLGEFKTADYLIQKYQSKFEILITTTTISAAKYANDHYGNKIIHQFAPLDISTWVKRFLNFWKPSLIIWIESDLWPITLTLIKKNNIPAILINLRLSPKSFRKWCIFPSTYNILMNCFSDVFAQSKIDQSRVQSLTTKKIRFIGNFKFTNIDKKNSNNIEFDQKNKSNIITLMLASTHANEESMIISSIEKLIKKYKNLYIIIAPRHPERINEIISLCSSYNIPFQIESNKIISKLTIIKSFGHLSSYFKITDIVFLGGSLVQSGGHNPIEPAKNMCSIITGPYIFNWQNTFEEMFKNEACLKINSIKELNVHIENLINDKAKLNNLKLNAYNFSKKQIVETKYLDIIISNYASRETC